LIAVFAYADAQRPGDAQAFRYAVLSAYPVKEGTGDGRQPLTG
jgi:hypothetical protein